MSTRLSAGRVPAIYEYTSPSTCVSAGGLVASV
jgi:hypothetical protein